MCRRINFPGQMLKELKTLFAQQAEQELLQTTRDFHSCRQEEGQSVSSYVLKMKGYIDNLERLGHPVTLGLGSEKFGEVCLPERLVRTRYLDVAKVNDSLGLLEYYLDGEASVCGVWTSKDGANELFTNIVILFDFKSEKFGEVCLPERLVHTRYLDVAKVNDSLGLLEYYLDGEASVCGVWTSKDGANELFTKIYTVKVEGQSLYRRVLGFRNNGEVVIKVYDDNYEESTIKVYEPLSGDINGVGINGKRRMFYARGRDQARTNSLQRNSLVLLIRSRVQEFVSTHMNSLHSLKSVIAYRWATKKLPEKLINQILGAGSNGRAE
uniref:Zinc finger, CCHC-type n=1 Tax=Tanacetum cinerariifolium TaxID=118510 RepID=A0A6L2JZX4_TANCI|nr:zinc finger, CCHC-type [Tanacetum cinerariifolium]